MVVDISAAAYAGVCRFRDIRALFAVVVRRTIGRTYSKPCR